MRRQFFVIAISRLIAAAIQAAVGIGLARTTGPSIYGEVTAFAGGLIFVFIICGFGISSYLSRARALRLDDIVATALYINVAGSFVGVALVTVPLLVGLLPVTSGPVPVLALLVVGTAFDKNVDAALAVLIADGERSAPAANVMLRRIITAVVFFGLLSVHEDPVVAYCIGSMVGPALGQAHISWLLKRKGVQRGRRTAVKKVLRKALPFAVNDVAVQSKSLVVIVVAAANSPTAAGLYSAAAKLIAPSELAASTLGGVILPRASVMTAHQQRATALKLLALALMVAPVAALLAIFAAPVVVFILGDEYRDAAAALAILSMTLPLLVLGSPVEALLQAMRREGVVGLSSVAAAVALPLAVLVGALWGGAAGAAIGVLAVTAMKACVLFTAVFVFAKGAAKFQAPNLGLGADR